MTSKEGVQHCKTTHRDQHMGDMNSCPGTNKWGPNIKRQRANRKEIIIEPNYNFQIKGCRDLKKYNDRCTAYEVVLICLKYR